MGNGPRPERGLTGAELEELLGELRRGDAAARADALDRLRAWQGRALDAALAEDVLNASTLVFDRVSGAPGDVGELLVRLLWPDPTAVPTEVVERSYVLAAESARRAMLHLLALRVDDDGVDAVGRLLGLHGPWDLLPSPTDGLLTPLLGAPGAGRLAEALVWVAWRRGWAEQVAELLGEMALAGQVSPVQAEAVAEGLTPLVEGLVDTCDRAAALRGSGGDLSRADRRRLDALVPLLAVLPGEAAERLLVRTLSSADPRVAARAAVVLARRGGVVGEERVALLARDPEARGVLEEGYSALGRHFALPAAASDERALAEADLVRWLAAETQLGTTPDEVEHRGVLPAPAEWGDGRLHLFAFRLRPPHWSAERGWMMGAVGPFDAAAEYHPRRTEGFGACSVYAAEDGAALAAHVQAISEAVVLARRGEVA